MSEEPKKVEVKMGDMFRMLVRMYALTNKDKEETLETLLDLAAEIFMVINALFKELRKKDGERDGSNRA